MRPVPPDTTSCDAWGLYVHIPFCRTRCAFCAFYLEIHHEHRATFFLDALARELHWYTRSSRTCDRPAQTLYLGGGTPTSLTPTQLCGLIHTIRAYVPLAAGAEVTVEAHPETLTQEMAESLRGAGVTRLSLGGESFEQEELLRAGRPASSEATASAVHLARAVGFEDINVDLMYGLPGQTLLSWTRTVEAVVAFGPSHVSCYALTVEDGSALANQISMGRAHPPDPDLQMELDRAAEVTLHKAGYRRYEISNYARPGHACRHNLLYWQNGDYLGLGPSAQSYVQGVRFGNIADLDRYGQLLAEGVPPLEYSESLSPERRAREALVFGLRQTAGVELALVDELCKDAQWQGTLTELIRGKMLERSGSHLHLSDRGRHFADTVAWQLL
ncbi:coproporphyrinogen III oxidase [Nitrospira sp.]|nr:coproporphyrinogen III oxidase [Nitrospira sp.]